MSDRCTLNARDEYLYNSNTLSDDGTVNMTRWSLTVCRVHNQSVVTQRTRAYVWTVDHTARYPTVSSGFSRNHSIHNIHLVLVQFHLLSTEDVRLNPMWLQNKSIPCYWHQHHIHLKKPFTVYDYKRIKYGGGTRHCPHFEHMDCESSVSNSPHTDHWYTL